MSGRRAKPSLSKAETSEPSSAGSSSPINAASGQGSAQSDDGLYQPLKVDESDGFDTETDIETDDSGELQSSQPYRFTGPPSTWKTYTEEDRAIAASLEQIQNSDLAAHLYNTHALKRRVRRPASETTKLKNCQSRDSWAKSKEELQYTDESGLTQTELIPPDYWTAWPLPPPPKSSTFNNRPRKGLIDSTSDEWEIGGTKVHDAGEELREELLAVFLRLAKERWRESEARTEAADDHTAEAPGRSQSRSKSIVSSKSRRSTSRLEDDLDDNYDSSGNSLDDDRNDTKNGKGPPLDSFARPVFSADDARAKSLLQPSINSILSKLDEVAMAVRRTRINHFPSKRADRHSHGESASDAESDTSQPRSSQKARLNSERDEETSTRPSSRATSAHTHRKGKTKKKGSRVTEEASDTDHVLQSSSDESPSRNNTHKRRRRRSSSRRRTTSITSVKSASSNRGRVPKKGLMDWSEVLGLAAIKGWDQQALARTAQRCASLFGESMSFLALHENTSSTQDIKPIQFTPSTIAAPDKLFAENQQGQENPNPERPFFPIGTLRCPHTDCFGHKKNFPIPYRVVEHCIRSHGYDPRKEGESSQKEKVGGVHVDGFLQPITLKRGWLGHGRAKAKANKKVKTGGEDEQGKGKEVVGGVEPSVEL